MLFSKVPVQLSKGEVANTKNSKKLVSAHYGEKKKKKEKNPNHPTPAKLEFQISRMGGDDNLWESINTIKANSQEKTVCMTGVQAFLCSICDQHGVHLDLSL